MHHPLAMNGTIWTTLSCGKLSKPHHVPIGMARHVGNLNELGQTQDLHGFEAQDRAQNQVQDSTLCEL